MSKAKNPWLADAALDATGEMFELRTVADFLKVPENRRRVCLREFHSWLFVQVETITLLGLESHECQFVEPDVFRWLDDGNAMITVKIQAGELTDK